MKRRLFAALLLLSCSWNAMGAAPEWAWARAADVSAPAATANATAVAADPAGNVYVAGTYSRAVTFGATTLTPTNANYTDVYVAKYDSAGSLQWVLPIGGVACSAGGLAASATKVYLVGDCTYGASFGGPAVPAHPAYGKVFFVAALDPAGRFTQVVGSSGAGSMTGSSVALDADGNVLVAGTFDRSINVYGVALTNTGNNTYGDAYVMKINGALNQLQWLRSGGSTDTDHGYAVTADASGNVLLAGDFGADVASASASFGTTTLTIPSFRSGEGFVAKLDKDGNWQWARAIGGWAFDEARGVITDNTGNVYVTGRFSVYGTFGAIELQAVSLNSYYVFVTKLDKDGNFKWAQQAGSAENLIGSHASGLALTLSAAGNPLAGGHFGGEGAFGSTVITSYGQQDAFVIELDAANGNYLNITRAGGGSDDIVTALASGPGGRTIVAGTFEDSASFGSDSLTTGRLGEFFIEAPFVGVLKAATQPPTANAVVSGALSARTIVLQDIGIPSAELAGGVSLFIAANIRGTIYCRTAAGWTTELVPYMSGISQAPASVSIVNNTNLANHVGTTVLVGYGRGTGAAALNDMLQGKKYAVVHTVAQ